MTNELPFSMWGWPGPNAAAGIQESESGERFLSIFLDPVNLAVLSAPFPDGPIVTARFLRQLARVCAQLSAELDPTGAPLRPPGAHRAAPENRASRGERR